MNFEANASTTRWRWVPALVLVLGSLAWRISEAAGKALNPDEVLISLIARPENWLDESRAYHHPPFFYFLLHWLLQLGSSEFTLRAISLASGVAAPLFLWAWMRRARMPVAGLIVLIAGLLGGGWHELATEARGYMLCLALFAGAAWMQQRWLAQPIPRNLAMYALFLWLSLLTEFGAAFGWIALGAFAWLERRRLGAAWWGVQAVAALILLVLYFWQVRDLQSEAELSYYISGYLKNMLVQPGENWAWFAIRKLPGALQYLVGNHVIAALLLAGTFASAWNSSKARNFALAALLAMLLALAAAMVQRYPLGPTRHSAILALMMLVAGAAGWQSLQERLSSFHRWLPLSLLLLMVTTLGIQTLRRNYQPSAPLAMALQQALFLAKPAPWVWTEMETIYMLRHYAQDQIAGVDQVPVKALRIQLKDGRLLESFRWAYSSERRLQLDLDRAWRGSGANACWFLDSGFTVMEGVDNPAFRQHGVQLFRVDLP